MKVRTGQGGGLLGTFVFGFSVLRCIVSVAQTQKIILNIQRIDDYVNCFDSLADNDDECP